MIENRNIKDACALKYHRLRYLIALAAVLAYFTAAFLGQLMKLRILAEKAALLFQHHLGVSHCIHVCYMDSSPDSIRHRTVSSVRTPPPSMQLVRPSPGQVQKIQKK